MRRWVAYRIPHEIKLNQGGIETDSDDSSSGITRHSANTDDSEYIPMTLKPIYYFSNQIFLKIGKFNDDQIEKVYPKVLRQTITRMHFGMRLITCALKNYCNPSKMNCLYWFEELIMRLQTVYNNHFGHNRSLKVTIPKKIFQDLKLPEDQNLIIRKTHEP